MCACNVRVCECGGEVVSRRAIADKEPKKDLKYSAAVHYRPSTVQRRWTRPDRTIAGPQILPEWRRLKTFPKHSRSWVDESRRVSRQKVSSMLSRQRQISIPGRLEETIKKTETSPATHSVSFPQNPKLLIISKILDRAP